MKIKILSFALIILIPTISFSQNTRQVEWEAADVAMDASIAGGAYRLIGNVVFRHEGALMYCDSAYFYPGENSLDAFKNIHINQGDSVHLYGDILHYNGNNRLAEVRTNVRLEGQNTVLNTESLDFDLSRNVGYYINYADIVSGTDNLRSKEGYYYNDTEIYFFIDSVELSNPDYDIITDTLRYHIPTSTAYFFGPTEIIGDSSYIYCENGWYNTDTNISMLKEKVFVRNVKQTLEADSLYYEREEGYGEAFSNITVIDFEQNTILKGNHAYVNEKDEWAQLTELAQLIYITDEDSIFVHADTLRAVTNEDGFRQINAYYGVKFFKSDLQGKCDSLFYSTADSVLRLYTSPVLWYDVNQLSADYIEIRTKNNQIDQLFMENSAFIINREDSVKYNQIKGTTMLCYFMESELRRINASGNGQTVYYVKNEEELIGVNLAESSDIIILFEDDQVSEIKFITMPVATLYPVEKAPENQMILEGFNWNELSRPKNKEEIFFRE